MVLLTPDITGFFLPFLFVLAIVFGSLEMSGVFKGKAVKLLIAAVIALFAAASPMVLALIQGIIPYAAILFIAVFFVGFLWKLGSKRAKKDYTLMLIIAALILIALSAFGDQLTAAIGISISSDNFLIGVGLIFVLIILIAAYRKFPEEKQ